MPMSDLALSRPDTRWLLEQLQYRVGPTRVQNWELWSFLFNLELSRWSLLKGPDAARTKRVQRTLLFEIAGYRRVYARVLTGACFRALD